MIPAQNEAGTIERYLVLVTTSFPIQGDGSEAAGSFVADLVLALARHMRVRVVAPGASATREQWSQGIEVFRYAAPSRPLSTLKPWRLKDFCWIVRVLRGGQVATRQAASGVRGGIFALWGLPCGAWARRAGRISKMRYSIWLLGSDVWTLGRIPVLRTMLARVIREAQQAYADGYQLAAEAQNIGKTPVAFLPSTRELTSNSKARMHEVQPFRLLFLGRWHHNKGVDILLGALDELSDEDWSRVQVLEIQGGGPLEPAVKKGVAALRARGRPVEIGRFLSKAEAEAAISRSDWVLVPSRVESIPVVFSDAMKSDRPIIATPVGDLPFLLDKFRCGVLSETVDSKGFAAALRSALSKSPLDYLEGVKSVAPMFSIQAVVNRLLQDGV